MADFVIKNPRCPECGQLANGIAQMVLGKTYITVDEMTGEADYDGEMEVYWDGHKFDTDGQGRKLLMCPDGHEWPMEEETDG